MVNDLELYGKLKTAYLSIENEGEQECFISFLRYCDERLEQGASVQEIWNSYQKMNGKEGYA